MFVVFDLDGTLAKIEHRRHFVEGEKKDWDSFFDACDKDEPNWPVIETALTMRYAGHRVEIWSGRSNVVLVKTRQWLTGVGLGTAVLIMRNQGDRTVDWKLKQSWMCQYGRSDLVFDDRKSVVDMWRRNGIPCFQVAEGDF